MLSLKTVTAGILFLLALCLYGCGKDCTKDNQQERPQYSGPVDTIVYSSTANGIVKAITRQGSYPFANDVTSNQNVWVDLFSDRVVVTIKPNQRNASDVAKSYHDYFTIIIPKQHLLQIDVGSNRLNQEIIRQQKER